MEKPDIKKIFSLINKFKSKFSKKKSDELDEEYEEYMEGAEEDEENESEDDGPTTTFKTMKIDKSELNEEDEEATESVEEDEKESEDVEKEEIDDPKDKKKLTDKEKKSKLIKSVLIGGILLYVATEILFPTGKEKIQTPQVEKIVKKDKSKKLPKKIENSAPVETKPEEVPIVKDVKESVTQPIEEKVPNEKTAQEPTQNEVTKVEGIDVPEITEEVFTESFPKLNTPIDNEAPNPTPVVESIGETPKNSENTEGAKMGQLIYEAPPEYTNSGRGLVYNCLGKHWACVEKDEYLKCKKNQDYKNSKKESLECAIKNVYANDVDCRIVQLHYINTNENTSFCQNK